MEILSSTSRTVCELWSGKEVIRAFGEPKMKEIIVHTVLSTGKTEVLGISEALTGGLYQLETSTRYEKYSQYRVPRWGRKMKSFWVTELKLSPSAKSRKKDNDLAKQLDEIPPNITLNVRGSVASNLELWSFVLVGLFLQCAVLSFSALAVYRWEWRNGNGKTPAYGYRCFLFGTTSVVFGVLLCGHVIEGSTSEHVFSPKDQRGYQVICIQKACKVEEGEFESFATFHPLDDPAIRTSWLNEEDHSETSGPVLGSPAILTSWQEKGDYSVLAAFATSCAIVGYIVQFVGLRALHWSGER